MITMIGLALCCPSAVRAEEQDPSVGEPSSDEQAQDEQRKDAEDSCCQPSVVSPVTRERAWTSPIWYTPASRK